MNASLHALSTRPANVSKRAAHLSVLEDHIAAIVQQRQQQAEQLDQQQAQFKQCVALARAQGLNIDNEHIVAIEQNLRQLKQRFQRKTLTVAVTGYARMGKSTLLQNACGLDNILIPASNDSHCTGTVSRICHRDDVAVPYADIHCYDETSLLEEKIAPYYAALALDTPATLDEFQALELSDSLCSAAFHKEHLKQLRLYQTHLDDYRSLLTAGVLREQGEAIVQYIAQYDPAHPERKFYAYLAVREVTIYCTFPSAQMASIELLDMPGLGDTQLGSQQRLLKTVAHQADILLFIRRPQTNVNGDVWLDNELNFYNEIDQILPGLPLNQWGILVLNHIASPDQKTDNYETCRKMKTLAEENRVLDFADIAITDVSCAEQVRNMVLQPAIERLAQHIETFDGHLLAHLKRDLAQFKAHLVNQLSSFGSNSASGQHRLFEELFDQIWDQLTQTLETGVLAQYEQQRYEPSEVFVNDLTQVFATVEQASFIPSAEEIYNKHHGRSCSYRNLFNEYLDQIRVNLTSGFQELDQGLGQIVTQLREDIAQSLQQTALKKLGEHLSGDDFLRHLYDLIQQDAGQTLLKQALVNLLDYRLAYHGNILHRIRACLDDLHSDKDTWMLAENELTPDNVHLRLQQAFSSKVMQIREALSEDILIEPNTSNYAVCEQFIDRIIRSEQAKKDWRIFLHQHRDRLWADDFGHYVRCQQLQDRLNTLV